jgi:hypothetical protein
MRKRLLILLAIAVVFVGGFLLGNRLMPVQGQANPGAGFAAIPGQVGGQDIFGPYDVVKGWPQDISTLPGNEKWTYGAGQGIFAESPNRVFMLFRGELPNIPRPQTKLLPEFGPSIQFPIGRLPWRDATVSALPGAGEVDTDILHGERHDARRIPVDHVHPVHAYVPAHLGVLRHGAIQRDVRTTISRGPFEDRKMKEVNLIA